MDLKSFAEKRKQERKANSKFVSINPGESFTGEFLGIENFESSQFGKQIAFKFKIDGETKQWNRGDTGVTGKLINQMVELGVVEGKKVKISRLANEGKASVLTVELVDEGHGETSPGDKLEEVFKGGKKATF